MGCDCKGPVEPDTDCSRCNKPMSWDDGDGINVDPPEDPEDRICHECIWKELEALRTERAMHRDVFGHVKVVIVPIITADGRKYQVVVVGLSQTVRSVHVASEAEAKSVAHELRMAFGVVEDYVEEKLRGDPPLGALMPSHVVGTIKDTGTAYMLSTAVDADVDFRPLIEPDDGG